ncbi:hypothetical protein [Rhizobium sp. BK251]|uniref:hypothetical protein n=1 Tax=Rhizobium sp. BK251 TaxID=2512125 RepID=UPI001054072F|nr:hypothetical protein [Rhizobium sp. BK251]TCL76138.1 hypothetical protein EV286_101686 [Rhizobium sp. BK251]
MSSIKPDMLCDLLDAEVYDGSRDLFGALGQIEGNQSGADAIRLHGIQLSTEDLQDISRLVGIICIGVHANFNWLNAREPDAEAAKLTATRLIAQTRALRELVGKLGPSPSDR